MEESRQQELRILFSQIDAGLIDASTCKCPPVNVPFQGPKSFDSAPSIMLCGQCVGTDKVGHFFEEGLIYHGINTTHGEAYAIAFGYWTEGLMPPGIDQAIWTWLTTGTFVYYGGGNGAITQTSSGWGWFSDDFLGQPMDPNGTASPADLQANEAAWSFGVRFLAIQLDRLSSIYANT